MILKYPSLMFLLLFSSCDNEPVCLERPLTLKEKNFISGFNNKGLEVSTHRFNYLPDPSDTDNCYADYDGNYFFEISNDVFRSVSQKDSLRRESIKIVSELYTKVIEDSITYYTDEIRIIFEGETKAKPGKLRLGYLYQSKFKKEDLELFFGFKVTKKGNKYFRVSISQTIDSLKIYSESYVD